MNPVPASRIRLLAPVAIRGLLADLLACAPPRIALSVEHALNPEVARMIADGADFDIAITNPWYVTDLIAAGRVDPASHVPFGRVPLAVARSAVAQAASATARADHPRAIADLLRGAGRVAYTAPGTSGKTFLDALDRLGLRTELADRLVPMGPGYAAVSPVAAVAAGEVTLAIGPLTTVIAAPGVAVAGIFPADFGADIDMSVFLSANPSGARTDGAGEALAWLTDSGHDGFLRNRGMMRFRFPRGTARN